MTGTLEQEILAQEERLTRATREIDLDALDRIYADDILFTGLTGATCGKSSLMDEARRGAAERQAAAGGAKPFVASYAKDEPWINVSPAKFCFAMKWISVPPAMVVTTVEPRMNTISS